MLSISPYIEINPHIRFGKPIITGTRISVQDILEYLASGMSFEEIMEDFPELDMPKMLAALSYAAHKERITRIILSSLAS